MCPASSGRGSTHLQSVWSRLPVKIIGCFGHSSPVPFSSGSAITTQRTVPAWRLKMCVQLLVWPGSCQIRVDPSVPPLMRVLPCRANACHLHGLVAYHIFEIRDRGGRDYVAVLLF